MSNVGEGRRVAIIGAGPSGFYAAEQLLSQGFEVDLLDLLPTPFGLVRAGVAPDHPKIKSVTRMYEKTARKDGFRFFGGVQVGEDIRRAELLERYHAVLYAVGTGSDNRLGIPGEDRPGSYPATRFVAWYNGHPHACDDEYDLSATRAVVVGNGNVAIDIARMLVLDPDELAPTDTADHALGRARRGAGRGGRDPGAARAGAGGLHEPGAARAGRAVARRADRRPGRAGARRAQPEVARDRGRPDRQAQLRAAQGLQRAAGGRQEPPDHAALPALAGRADRRGRGRQGRGDADRAQPDRAGRGRRRCARSRPTSRR